MLFIAGAVADYKILLTEVKKIISFGYYNFC